MPLDHPAPPAKQIDLAAVEQRGKRTFDTMCDAVARGCHLYMSIPAEPERDLDLLVGQLATDVADLCATLRREREATHRARLVLAPHPGATPEDDTGCGCAVASLEELAVAVVESLRREREENEKRWNTWAARALKAQAERDDASHDAEISRAMLSAAVADRDKYKASLDQFLRDTSEAMSCLPGCDSQAHEELCPVVNPAAAWRMLNADRDRYRAALEFYGAKATYQPREHPACGSIPPEIEEDMGERARLVLLAPPTPAAQAKGE